MSKVASTESSGSVVEVEFSITDSRYPFVSATKREDCVMELAEMTPRDEDRYAEFFSVTGIDTEEVEAIADSYDTLEVYLLREYDGGGLFEFLSSGSCPAFTLAELGALPREAVSLDGEGRIVAEIPAQYDASTVVERFLEEIPNADLVSKRHRDAVTPVFTNSTIEQVLEIHLTDRQQEVLRTAHDAGYYEWPRETTGSEIADELGISSATFSEHIHAAERKLFGALLGARNDEQRTI